MNKLRKLKYYLGSKETYWIAWIYNNCSFSLEKNVPLRKEENLPFFKNNIDYLNKNNILFESYKFTTDNEICSYYFENNKITSCPKDVIKSKLKKINFKNKFEEKLL